MSEKEPNSPKYLENHPDAVQDVEKAHTMAIAGSYSREIASHLRNVDIPETEAELEDLQTGGFEKKKSLRDEFNNTLEAVQKGEITKDQAFSALGHVFRQFDSIRKSVYDAPSVLDETRIISDSNEIDIARNQIQRYKQQIPEIEKGADELEAKAGEEYDAANVREDGSSQPQHIA